MLFQTVRFDTTLDEDAFAAAARDRVPAFLEVPGLIQKFFVRFDDEKGFGGVYLWETRAAIEAYRASELSASVGEAYEVVGETEVESAEVLLALREFPVP